MNENLVGKSEIELKAIFEESARLLKEKEDTRKQTAFAEIETIVMSANLTIPQLKQFVKDMTAKLKLIPQTDVTHKIYANPQNLQERWTDDNKSRQPRWLTKLLKNGSKLEDLEVNVEVKETQSA